MGHPGDRRVRHGSTAPDPRLRKTAGAGSDNPSEQAKITAASGGSVDDDKKQPVSSVAFNNQVYLLDYFSSNDTSALFSRKAHSPLVRPINEGVLNKFLEDKKSAMDFINYITPEEKAQLIPSVRMFVVSSDGENQEEVTLTDPTNLMAGIKSPDFYSGAVAGLKSINMKIDGGTSPVTGKIYNFTISLVFDSINTFFQTCTAGASPEFQNVTWADLFRASDSIGGYRLKIAISWKTANSGLRTKYNLERQTFSGYLSFIKSDISIDENLKTIVKSTFQSMQEAVWASPGLFDIFDLNYDAEVKRVKEEQEHVSGNLKALYNTRKQLLEKSIAKKEAALAALIRESVRLNLQSEVKRGQGRFTAEKMAADPELRAAATTLRGDGTPPLVDFQAERIWARYKQESQGKQQQFGGFRSDLGNEGSSHAFRSQGRAYEAVENMVKQLNEIRRDVVKQATDYKTASEQEGAKIENELDVYRTKKINDVLQAAIFSQKIFCRLKVNSTEVQTYLTNMRQGITKQSADVKNLFNPNTSKVSKTLIECEPGQGMPSSHSLSNADFKANAAQWSKDLEARQQAILLNKRSATWAQNSIEGKKEALNAKTHASRGNDYSMSSGVILYGTKQDKNKWGGSADATHEAGLKQIDEETSANVKKINDRGKKLTETRDLMLNKIPSLGGIENLEKELKEFKHIEVVTIGDLLSSIMNYLSGRSGKSEGQKAQIAKTRIFLTTIELRRAFAPTKVSKNLYNLPISITQLQKWFVNNVVATQRTTLTVQELFHGLIDIVQRAQMKKIQLSKEGDNKSSTKYVTQFAPYPVEDDGNAFIISKKVESSKGVLNGVVFYVTNQSFHFNYDRNPIAHAAAGIPHFIFGGQAQGALMKFKISEKVIAFFKEALIMDARASKKKQKAGGNEIPRKRDYLPAMFQVTLTLIGTPYFQMGMLFYVATPTISDANWFHLSGYYRVTSLEHSFDANGQFITTISGPIQQSQTQIDGQKARNAVKIVPGADLPDIEKGKETSKSDRRPARIAPPTPTVFPAPAPRDWSDQDIRDFREGESRGTVAGASKDVGKTKFLG